MVKLKGSQLSKQHSVLILCFFFVILALQGGFVPQWRLTALTVQARDGGGGESFSDSHVKSLERKVTNLEETVTKLQRRFWLETLEPIWQYRPRYVLGKTTDMENKDQVIPYFLANFVDASNTTTYKRRIYIDLGIRNFESSICYMMQNYPVKFDKVYAFESEKDMSNLESMQEDIKLCIDGTTAGSRGYTLEHVYENFKFFYNWIGLDDNSGTIPSTKGFSQFVKEIGIQEDDFVVLKIDIEEMEYDLLNRIMEDGTYKLLDEIFVEIHYNHPEWYNPWFGHSRNDAQILFNKARDAGIFLHPWP